MKILAINGSPRGEDSNTMRMLNPMIKGMKAAGAKVEVIHLAKQKINYCVGCFTCWIKTPGKCVFKDDMVSILNKVNEADTLIFGTPLYFYTMTGMMKTFLERMLPLAEPFLVEINNKSSHPIRRSYPWKMVLVSNAGFPEKEHFESLILTFQKVAESLTAHNRLDAVVLRTHGEVLKIDRFHDQLQQIFEALELAGMEFVQNEKISQSTLDSIEKNIFPDERKQMIEKINKYWQLEIQRHQNRN